MKKKPLAKVDPSQAERRNKRHAENVRLLEECKEKGVMPSPAAFFLNDEVWDWFIKNDAAAETVMGVEESIRLAVTYLRWRQKNGHKTNATVNYDDIEF